MAYNLEPDERLGVRSGPVASIAARPVGCVRIMDGPHTVLGFGVYVKGWISCTPANTIPTKAIALRIAHTSSMARSSVAPYLLTKLSDTEYEKHAEKSANSVTPPPPSPPEP